MSAKHRMHMQANKKFGAKGKRVLNDDSIIHCAMDVQQRMHDAHLQAPPPPPPCPRSTPPSHLYTLSVSSHTDHCISRVYTQEVDACMRADSV